MNPCILVSTSEQARWMAQYTRVAIDALWAQHPPLYLCGAADPPDSAWLPRRVAHEDWIGILDEALSHLQGAGYDQVYLVLDDHPPLYSCSARHLNATLPRLLAELDALYIGLNGWGQGRAPNGERLDASRHRIERVAPDFAWRFSLHPGLWNLTDLRRLCQALVQALPADRRTAWAFERQAAAGAADVPGEWNRRCYRVCGSCMSASVLRRALRAGEMLAYRGARFAATRVAGGPAAQRVEDALEFLRRYYEGPYPLYWSGLLQKGRPYPLARRFLRWRGRRGTLAALDAAARAGAPA